VYVIALMYLVTACHHVDNVPVNVSLDLSHLSQDQAERWDDLMAHWTKSALDMSNPDLAQLAWVNHGSGWLGPYVVGDDLAVPFYQEACQIVFSGRYEGQYGLELTSASGDVVGSMTRDDPSYSTFGALSVEIDELVEDGLYFVDGRPALAYVDPIDLMAALDAGPDLDGSIRFIDPETGQEFKKLQDYGDNQRSRNQRLSPICISDRRFDLEVRVDRNELLFNHWASIVSRNPPVAGVTIQARINSAKSTNLSAVVEVVIPDDVSGGCLIHLRPALVLWIDVP